MDFQSLWDAHPDLIVVTGSDDRLLYSNQVAQRLGFRLADELPETFAASASPFVWNHGQESYQVLVSPGEDGMKVFAGRRAPPSSVPAALPSQTSSLSDPNELLASVLDQMGEGVIAADITGRVFVWNPAASRLLGIAALSTVEEGVGVEVLDSCGQPARGSLFRALDGEEVDGEELWVRPLGATDGIWMTITARPLRDSDGAISGAVAIFRDSSGQRQLTETLGQARDAALQATRLKSEFLANMSHEIRTPLNGIIGLGEMLAQTGLDQAQREYVSTIRLCSESLLSIVNSVLDFSKIEAGKTELESEPFELEATVEEALELASTGLAGKPVELYARLAPDLPSTVRGDPHRLRQVLLNFLSNAIKFTAAGHVALDVERLEEAEGKALLRFSVHDTGIGVDSLAQERLFLPFSQADSSSKRSHGGTGLGLVISRKLAEMMGGEAGFSSSGGGSVFYFTVRLEVLKVQRFHHPLHDLPSLVVRLADAGLQAATCDYLAQRGARVRNELGAESGIVICDREECLSALECDDEPPRVVFLGASRPAHQGRHVSYLRKPLKFSRLVRLLREIAGTAHDSGRRATLTLPLASRSLQGRVLVAEDNPINRRVMLLMLEKMGLQVQGAENGKEAAEAALRGEFDLVLMDCQMPVMDGLEATRVVRDGWKAASHLPIIAVTANALEGEAERCRQGGMDDYVAKPVTAELLREVLERWLPR